MQNLLSFTLMPKGVNIMIYRNIILSVLLCACESLSLTLKEEYRLKVFENGVMIFRPKRDEVTGEWRIIHN